MLLRLRLNPVGGAVAQWSKCLAKTCAKRESAAEGPGRPDLCSRAVALTGKARNFAPSLLWLEPSVLQREEPVAAVGRAHGNRHQADVQS